MIRQINYELRVELNDTFIVSIADLAMTEHERLISSCSDADLMTLNLWMRGTKSPLVIEPPALAKTSSKRRDSRPRSRHT